MLSPKDHPEEAEQTFKYRLALELGKDVTEIEAMSEHQVAGWLAYFVALGQVQEELAKRAKESGR